jgi:hypothetical protein
MFRVAKFRVGTPYPIGVTECPGRYAVFVHHVLYPAVIKSGPTEGNKLGCETFGIPRGPKVLVNVEGVNPSPSVGVVVTDP